MRFGLRSKLLVFAIAIALIPLGLAGRTMIQKTQEELISAANDELSVAARQIVSDINDTFENAWVAPILLIRNAIDNPNLGVQEKIALLTAAIQDIPDLVALQLSAEGVPQPIVTSKDVFANRIEEAGLDPGDVLRLPPDQILTVAAGGDLETGGIVHVPETDDWLTTLIVPLANPINGRRVALSARISLNRIRDEIRDHPHNAKGEVAIIDMDGLRLFDPERSNLRDRAIAEKAVTLMRTESRALGVEPYDRADGSTMLGAYGFPRSFNWGVLVEMPEDDAYVAVAEMRNSLLLWLAIGLALAVAGSIIYTLRISRPILAIGDVAQEVSRGNLQVRVEGVTANDEIGDLATRINEMIQGLTERFNLEKFVSGETLQAVRGAQSGGVKLGGERRNVTVFFSDIRGFTAFSERHEPEVVVEMLNTYLRHQAYIVKQFDGDIDKYVGDELVAVFTGPDMAVNAVRCAVAIQEKMAELTRDNPEWGITIGIGINSGEVVMGAMGSEERMDYTILGDTVNLGARLCSAATRTQTLISESTYRLVADLEDLLIVPLPPVSVKGKAAPIQIYEVTDRISEAASA